MKSPDINREWKVIHQKIAALTVGYIYMVLQVEKHDCENNTYYKGDKQVQKTLLFRWEILICHTSQGIKQTV